MTDNIEQLEKYQTDQLILLVGSNPLPNYVAAKLLVKPGGRVILLASKDTGPVADNLRNFLHPLKVDIQKDVAESSPQAIYTQVLKLVNESRGGSVGLNYTGGTKAMAVHAYAAARAARPDMVCSYLDSRSCEMVFDAKRGDQAEERIFVRELAEVRLTAEDVIKLHGMQLANKPKTHVQLNRIHHAIMEAALQDAWSQWCHSNLRRGHGDHRFKTAADLRAIHLPIETFGRVADAFSEIGQRQTASFEDWCVIAGFLKNSDGLQNFAKWLDGMWFEEVVLNEVQSIAAEAKFDYVAMTVNAANSKFEFDVVAMRGYQLFAFSVTTSKEKSLCKNKLFEASIRARQMGGDEAKTILICFHDDPSGLLNAFKSEQFAPEGGVTVLGRPDLGNLATALHHWIRMSL